MKRLQKEIRKKVVSANIIFSLFHSIGENLMWLK